MGYHMSSTTTTLAANGTTSIHHHETTGVPGVQFSAIGTFGGGTLIVEQKHSDGTWRAIAGASYTASVSKVIDVACGSSLRATLSSSTTPSVFVEFSDMCER